VQFPWWYPWLAFSASLPVGALVFYAVYLRRRVPPKYSMLGLCSLAYFDNPYVLLYPNMQCTLHLGVVAVVPARWLARLRSCRDLDRAEHLARFTAGERRGAAAFLLLVVLTNLVAIVGTVVRIVMRVAGL
jgi:hypothetical protein